MKGRANIVRGIQNLKLAEDNFSSFMRDNPGTKGANLFKGYCSKINWILRDLITNPNLPEVVREGIKREIASDLVTVEAIVEKLALLNPDQREAVEEMIDIILTGETFVIEKV